MSGMNLSLTLNHINANSYELDILLEAEPNHFLAITSNKLNDDASTRVVHASLMVLKGMEGGMLATRSGVFTRGNAEEKVEVVLTKNRQHLGSKEISYPY